MKAVGKLNNVLGYLTAMSFVNPELSNDLVEPLNTLSEVISEVENLHISDVTQWVSVDDRMPEDISNGFSKWVLAIDANGYVFRTRYDYEYSQWINKANVPDNKVTHWMELPKPPSNLISINSSK